MKCDSCDREIWPEEESFAKADGTTWCATCYDGERPLKPKAPSHSSWETSPGQSDIREIHNAEIDDITLTDPDAWMHESRGLTVVSAVELDDPEKTHVAFVYHISISRSDGSRPTDSDVDFVRRGFEMVGADEGPSHNGVVRHLWLEVESN